MRELAASIALKLVDGFSAPVRAATNDFHTFTAAMEKAKGRFEFGANTALAGEGMRRVAEGAERLVGGPIEAAEGYEHAMTRVGVRLKASREEMEELEGAAKGLGATMPFSAAQSAAGIEGLAHAGLDVHEILTALPHVAALATAADLELGAAASTTGQLLAIFGRDAAETGHVLDVVTLAASKSRTSVGEMADTLRNVADEAGVTNLSIEKTTALMASLARTGRTGGRAGSVLANVLSRLSATDPKAQKALDYLHVKAADHGKLRDPVELLGEIYTKAAKQSEEHRAKLYEFIFGGVQAANVARHLGADIASGYVSGVTQELEAASGTTAAMATKMMSDGTGASRVLATSAENVKTTLGDNLLPLTDQVKAAAIGVTRSLGAWAAAHPKLSATMLGGVGVLGLFAAGSIAVIAALSGLSSALGVVAIAMGVEATGAQILGVGLRGLARATIGEVIPSLVGVSAAAEGASAAFLATPVGWIVGGLALVAGAAYLVVHNWEPIRGFFSGLWDDIAAGARTAGSYIDEQLGTTASRIVPLDNGPGRQPRFTGPPRAKDFGPPEPVASKTAKLNAAMDKEFGAQTWSGQAVSDWELGAAKVMRAWEPVKSLFDDIEQAMLKAALGTVEKPSSLANELKREWTVVANFFQGIHDRQVAAENAPPPNVAPKPEREPWHWNMNAPIPRAIIAGRNWLHDFAHPTEGQIHELLGAPNRSLLAPPRGIYGKPREMAGETKGASSSSAPARVDLHVRLDADGRLRTKRLQSNGNVNLSVDTGFALGGT